MRSERAPRVDSVTRSIGPLEARLRVGERSGEVSTLLLRPPQARVALVLAHGAGAGMRHPFLEAMAHRLALSGVATFRYQFPYMEAGGRRPDPRPVLLATVRAVVAEAAERLPDLPLLAGGKSMGGRMTSLAVADAGPGPLRGLVFLGFPLHAAGRPSAERGEHLRRVGLPMLFLQGTRDRLADLGLLEPLVDALGPTARLERIEGADHSFRVPRRLGTSGDAVLDTLAHLTAKWADSLA